MRVRYISEGGLLFSVWLMRDYRTPIRAGTIQRGTDNSWTARLATDPRKVTPGWQCRSDGARWLALAVTEGRAAA